MPIQQYPLQRHPLDSALGYFYLGLFNDAWDELESLPVELRLTDPVLEMRLAVYHALHKWNPARILAESLAQRFPENPNWWIQWAYALRREKSVTDARGVLWQAVQIHPASPTIIYNLACYACLLGEMEESKRLLKQAFALEPDFKITALDDPDLNPIFGGVAREDQQNQL
ncbi:MAG: hypothetical protein ABI162_01665 [Luteolibacter sp.]